MSHALTCLRRARSVSHVLEFGVPQGSVLGPLLYSMYTSPLGEIVRRHQMFYYFYADDTRLFITFRTFSVSDMNLSNAKLVNCVRDMDAWMLSNKLKLNKDKSEVLVISSSYRGDLGHLYVLLIYVMRLYPAPPVHAILESSLISPFVWYLMLMQSVNRPFSIFVILALYANILLMTLQRSLFMPS